MPMLSYMSETPVKLAVVGLGYVGLPLAVEFGKKQSVIGFDTNVNRVEQLLNGFDGTREVSRDDLESATRLELTSKVDDIASCNVYIITVPTPVDARKRPDLRPLLIASQMVGKLLKKNDVVIYESTVFPGCTEEVCVPELERSSGLSFNQDFFCGYSPERINPGDKLRRLVNVVKVTSGSNPQAARFVDDLYGQIVSAGTHKADSIRIAEAAKVIENTQRDLNIALVNELAIIFNKLEIDTLKVLEAAGTKWNFLPFRPGLVGGHCISVDPYYLTQKAEEVGYKPEVILAGRRVNDSMGAYVASQLVKNMVKKTIPIEGARILIMGYTFKENCPDTRNTRVVDIYTELTEFGCSVDIYDPVAQFDETTEDQLVKKVDVLEPGTYDGIVLAVAHREFLGLGFDKIKSFGKGVCLVYDLKGLYPDESVDLRL